MERLCVFLWLRRRSQIRYSFSFTPGRFHDVANIKESIGIVEVLAGQNFEKDLNGASELMPTPLFVENCAC